jgi:steroid delta-isomerase-like uncharacterized protein
MKHFNRFSVAYLMLFGLVCAGYSSTLQEENKALVRRVMVEIPADDWETASKLHSSDFIYHGPNESITMTREELGQEITMLASAFPDFSRTIEDMIAEGDKVVCRITWRGTHKGEYKGMPATGKQVTSKGIVLLRITDGKIAEAWDQYDELSFVQQLGAGNDDGSAIEPSPAMKKLEGLVGDWAYKGEQVDPPVDGLPYGPAGKFSGTFANRFILDGLFLESKTQDKNPSGKTSIFSITGFDAKTKNYVANGFVSDGSRETSVETVSPDGRIWTSNSTMTTSSGKKVLVKSVAKYSSDWSSYKGTTEVSPDDGKTWKFWYKVEGKKLKK